MNSRPHPLVVGIAISVPLLWWAICLILPTFDDWTTLSSPNYDPDYWKYILPFGLTWRPGDAIMGYVNAWNYRLYPTLNHTLILLAHLGSTYLVFRLGRLLHFESWANVISTLFFYWSPCMLGTLLSVDALNQSYAHLWGLMAVWSYLSFEKWRKFVLWTLFLFLSVASKDNGLAWAIVPPILAYAFRRISLPTLRHHLGFALLLVALYAALRLLLPATDIHNGSYADDVVSLHSRLKGAAIWLGYTWSATDYIALFHAPSRNLWLVAFTFLSSLPFILSLFMRREVWTNRTFWLLLACLFIVASPHLLISLSIMNAYASLSMAALLVGWLLCQKTQLKRSMQFLFIFYMLSATITNVHHWYMAWRTSLPAKTISQDIVRKTGQPAHRVYCVIIRDDYPKYSSFCVPTDEAIGWGRAVWQQTGYAWPQTLRDTSIDRSASAPREATLLARKALHSGYDCAWIINQKKVEVIR